MSATTLIKALFATTIVVCLSSGQAAADPANFEVHGELGFKEITAEKLHPGDRFSTTHGIVGVAPAFGLGWIKRTRRGASGWQFRFGPELMASVIGDHNERGVSLGAVMKIGFHFHWLHGEVGYGVSSLSFRAEDIDVRSAGIMIHYGGGIDLGKSWALRGKVDGHINASHGLAAVVVGGGLLYRP